MIHADYLMLTAASSSDGKEGGLNDLVVVTK
jgi:hypothetical protein